MNQGCKTAFSGGILSLDKNNDTLAEVNSIDKIEITFCIKATTKD